MRAYLRVQLTLLLFATGISVHTAGSDGCQTLEASLSLRAFAYKRWIRWESAITAMRRFRWLGGHRSEQLPTGCRRSTREVVHRLLFTER